MKINSIAVLFAIPFIIISAISGYMLFINENDNYLIILIISMVILIAIYTLQPHIDFLWDKSHPKILDSKDKIFLTKFSSFYNNLNDEDKVKFENKIYVFTRSKDFKLIKKEKKRITSSFQNCNCSHLLFNLASIYQIYFKSFDRYFAYEHPFPTPKIQFLHSVEVNIEDKLAIFDIESLINSLNYNNRIFNIGIFAFSEIFLHLNENKILYTELEEKVFWDKISTISGFNKDYILNLIGFMPLKQFSILSTLFTTFTDKFETELPIQYNELKKIYNFK
ncbi:MAG: hypothetical protein R2771_09600 [Saprospiraceae bacterium]